MAPAASQWHSARRALVSKGRADIVFADPVRRANNARFVSLNPKASEFLVDWDHAAHDVVASLRAEAGRDPFDRRLTDLIAPGGLGFQRIVDTMSGSADVRDLLAEWGGAKARCFGPALMFDIDLHAK